MDKREEIVGWLREAAAQLLGYQQVQWDNGRIKRSDSILALSEVFRQRATQVEAMRCGECINKLITRPTYNGSASYEVVWCPHFTGELDFGCWHFERRD